ncbi:hypothetical protein [Lactobacillus sp. LL6]|uniref:hypothetical protein n=1 Tax=Lactobacillus sp. LL6 TaxID=2596827 RepID=UPI00118661AA|nr:hypothetical protein [Lactobacillus sp. LL6]TSO25562.1 hypothetical protein FOD82_00295 [Lactobacillus sp. LL6]
MKIKDERLENKDKEVIIRSFIVLNLLLLGFILFYGKNILISSISPNLAIFFIMLITVIYACLDFYISGTLLPDVEDKNDIKHKVINISEGLLSINGLGIILYLLNNNFNFYSLTIVIATFLLIDVIIVILTIILLFIWIKLINHH